MRLWVDDERPEPMGWVRCTGAPNAIRILDGGGVDELSLDHDLDSHVDTRNGESREMTGYDVAAWLEEQAQSGRWRVVPEEMRCHSQNPAGKARIEACIASIERMRDAGRDG